MTDLKKQFLKLCTPAKIYLVLSLISIIAILLQNLFDAKTYCVGTYKCNLNYSNIVIFVVKIVYTVIWAIILDSLCVNKYERLAWGLVMLPIILMFILIGVFMFYKLK